MKFVCDTTQFPSLQFCGPHAKLHEVWGFSNHYLIQLDPKIVNDTCSIHQKTCACSMCMSLFDKPSTTVVSPRQQPH